MKVGFTLIVVWYAPIDNRLYSIEMPRYQTVQTCLKAADNQRNWLAKRRIWPAYIYTRCIKEDME